MLFIVSLFIVVLTFHTGVGHAQSKTVQSNSPWYWGCITKQYGWGEGGNAEHGNDLSCFSYGTPITALLAGTVTYAGWTNFGYYEVTWRLDNPSAARGSPYAYAEDMAYGSGLWAGEHIRAGQVIGYSLQWVEFGLTPDWAYGISNWRWGVNSYFLIMEARNGYFASYTTSGTTYIKPDDKTQDKAEAIAAWNKTGVRRGTGIEIQYEQRIMADMRVPAPTSNEYTLRGSPFVYQNFGVYKYIHDPRVNRGHFVDKSWHTVFIL
jgi:hypothetical protein